MNVSLNCTRFVARFTIWIYVNAYDSVNTIKFNVVSLHFNKRVSKF